jgi:hypothetical protein
MGGSRAGSLIVALSTRHRLFLQESLINLLNEHMSISVADRINKSRKMELQGEPALPLQLYEDACFEPPPRPARAITSTRRLNQLSKEKLHRSRGVVNK